jgi:hypothetical protein
MPLPALDHITSCTTGSYHFLHYWIIHHTLICKVSTGGCTPPPLPEDRGTTWQKFTLAAMARTMDPKTRWVNGSRVVFNDSVVFNGSSCNQCIVHIPDLHNCPPALTCFDLL